MPKYVKILVPDDFEDDQVIRHSEHDETFPVWQPQYIKLLNHGFVGLVDFMGDDAAIVNAARVSYGAGTTRVNQDRGLIRYLLRHLHTTPFEMVDFKFHVKAPIFVFRQWHRHRTFSINEYSARYSVMTDEMYEPTIEKLAPQSKDNKQGRQAHMLSESDYRAVMATVDHIFEESYQAYKHLLGPNEETGGIPKAPAAVQSRIDWCKDAAVAAIQAARKEAIESEKEVPNPTEADLEAKILEYMDQNGVAEISTDFPGIARELARMVLPVATYSEMYWKGNLWNLMHFMKLRCDSHAQYEIRVYADALRDLITPHVEWAMEAWTDYLHEAKRLSRMEVDVLRQVLRDGVHAPDQIEALLKKTGVSKREITEFMATYLA